MKKTILFMLLLFEFLSPAKSAGGGDTTAVIELKKQIQALFDYDLDSTLILATRGLELSIKINYLKGQAEMLNVIGLVYRDQGKSEQALLKFEEAMKIAQRNNLESTQAAILSNIGMLHQNHGDYILALKNFLAALQIREKLKDDYSKGRLLNNIALVFTEQENYPKALEYYGRSVDLKLKSGDTVLAARTYNNIGIVYVNMGRCNDAVAVLNKALGINKRHDEMGEVATNIGNLGFAYDRCGDKQRAKEHYMRCIEMQEKMGLSETQFAIPLNNLGTIFLEENNYPEAEKLLLKSLRFARQRESKEDIREALGNLGQVYSKQRKFEEAFSVQQEFNALTETLANEKADQEMAEMMVKYETEKKEKQNELLSRENELHKMRLSQVNYVIAGLSVLIVLLVTMGFLFYRQRKLRLEQERIALEQKLLRSQMNPHFIFNSLQSIQGFMLTHKPEEAAVYLSDFARLIRMILENSRKEYCPLSDIIQLDEYYLKMQTLRFENKFDYEIQVDESLYADDILVPPMLLQPFIENAIEHGFKNMKRKGKIDIRIYRVRNELVMEVSDNGIGRRASENLKSTDNRHISLAMAITRERIESLNRRSKKKIRLEVIDLFDSEMLPSGTKVIFALPVDEMI